MRNRAILITTCILCGIFVVSCSFVVLVLLNFTPRELGPAMVTFWFVSVLVALTSMVTVIDYALKLRKENNRMQPRKILLASLRTGFLVGFTLTLLLALSSLRSLSLRDIILFVLTVVLIEFYFRTRKTR